MATSAVDDAAITAFAGGPDVNIILVFPVTVDKVVPVGDWTPNVAVPVEILARYLVTTPFTVLPLPVTVPNVVVRVAVVPSATRLPLASRTVMVRVV